MIVVLSFQRVDWMLSAYEDQGGRYWMQSTDVLLIGTVKKKKCVVSVKSTEVFVKDTTLISSSFSFSSLSTLFFISARASRVLIPLHASFLGLPALLSLSVV